VAVWSRNASRFGLSFTGLEERIGPERRNDVEFYDTGTRDPATDFGWLTAYLGN
jgi:hypothetical protein